MSDLMKAIMAAFASSGYKMAMVDGKYQPVRISDGQVVGAVNENDEIDGTGTLPLRFEVCKKPPGSAGRGPPDGFNLQVTIKMPDDDYKIFCGDMATILWQCKAINMQLSVSKQSCDALVHCVKKFVSMHTEFEAFCELKFWCIWSLVGMLLRQSSSRYKMTQERRQAAFSLPKITVRKRGRPRKQPADTSMTKSKSTPNSKSKIKSKSSKKAASVGVPAASQSMCGGNETFNFDNLNNGKPGAEDSSSRKDVPGDGSSFDETMFDSSVIARNVNCTVDMSVGREDDEDEGEFDISQTQPIVLTSTPRPVSSSSAKPSNHSSARSTSVSAPTNTSQASSRASPSSPTLDSVPASPPSTPGSVPVAALDAPQTRTSRKPTGAKATSPTAVPAVVDATIGTTGTAAVTTGTTTTGTTTAVATTASDNNTLGFTPPFGADEEDADSIIIWQGKEYTSKEVELVRKYACRLLAGEIKRVPASYKGFIYKFVENPNYNPSSDRDPPPPPARARGGVRARDAAPDATPTSTGTPTTPDVIGTQPAAKSRAKPKMKPARPITPSPESENGDPEEPAQTAPKDGNKATRSGRTGGKGKGVADGERGGASTSTAAKEKAGQAQVSTAVKQPAGNSRRVVRKKA
ncbi:hypothetical protein RhiJN_08582 [Ceratobasidium sp. AG-Ba]|nr:hypothetical protein RhiJN_08582 [Ceratobasidium sp. AG-Ba]QRW09366.1 hypothetical protein RhiLY_08365 [Ceratobasidium sp. AG-Ba]